MIVEPTCAMRITASRIYLLVFISFFITRYSIQLNAQHELGPKAYNSAPFNDVLPNSNKLPCLEPDIYPISDTLVCDSYILPTISGSNLTGSQAYYDAPNGQGSIYLEGFEIFTSGIYYAYDGATDCEDEESFVVTIGMTPMPVITGDSMICVGSTTFDAGGPFDHYIWNTGDTTQTIDASIAGLYAVTATDANGCTGTDEINLSIGALTIEITVDTSLCIGESSVLSANASGGTAPYTYTWDQGLGEGSSHPIDPLATTTYSVTAIDDLGCEGMNSVTVYVHDLPTPSILGDTIICDGDSTLLDASSGYEAYNWNTGDTIQQIYATSIGLYSVIVTDFFGCSGMDSIDVEVLPSPNVDAGLDQEICIGDTTTISAAGSGGTMPYEFNWDQGLGMGQSFDVYPDTSSTYSVIITDANNCSDEDQMLVTVYANPFLVIVGDTIICTGSTTQFDAGPGFTSYNWNTGDTTQIISVSTPGTYVVTVSDSNLCTNSDAINLLVGALTISITADTSLCIGDSIVISANATGGIAPYTYSWDQGLGEGPIHMISPGMTTTYSLTVLDDNGCSGEAQVTISVNGLAEPEIIGDTISCEGAGVILDGGDGFISYTWSTGDMTQYIEIDSSGSYILIVEDVNGCFGTDTLDHIVQPNLTVDAGLNQDICQGDSLSLTAEVTGGTTPYEYDWNQGQSTEQNFIVSPDTNTIYFVSVTDFYGCNGFDFVVVNVFENPEPEITGDSIICPGDSIMLDASSEFSSYNWNNGDTTQIIMISTPGTYIVTVTNFFGCEGIDSISVLSSDLSVDAGLDVEICYGDTVVISAEESGGLAPYSFSWDQNLGSGQTHQVYPDSSTLYTVMVTDSTGCASTDSVLITVFDLPSISITGNLEFCENDSTQLDAGGGFDSYLWSTGDTTQQITAFLEGSYSIIVTDGNGCQNVDSVDVIVFPMLIPIITGTDTICNGASTILNAGLGYNTYTWNTGDTTQFISVNNTGTYSVTVTDANNCSGSDDIIISMFAIPVVNAGQDTSICVGQFVTITANGSGGTPPYDFNWDQGLGSGASHVINPTTTTTYSVTLTDSNACVDIDQVIITVNEIPIASAGVDQFICAGEQTGITASATNGTEPYSYFWDQGLGGGATHIITPLVTTIYSVTVTDVNMCEGSDQLSITVYNLPSVEISGDTILCEGETTILDGGAGFDNYLWSTGDTSQLIVAGNPGSYILTITDSNGCEGTDSVNVIVHPVPVTDAGPDETICLGDSILIEGQASGGTPPYAYTWDQGLGGGQSHMVSPAITTSYTLTVSDANLCQHTDQLTISVNETPIADAGMDSSICLGDSAAITVNAINGAMPYSYFWDQGLGAGQTHNVSPNSSTTYTVTVTDDNGCEDTDQLIILVNSLPIVQISGDSIICAGETTVFDAGNGFDSYLWSTGEVTQSITLSTAGTHSVTVTDANGCAGIDSLTLIVNPNPIADAGIDGVICHGDSIIIEGMASGGLAPYAYTWDQGLGGGQSHMVSPAMTTIYTLTVSDANLCQHTDQLTISVNETPIADAGMDSSICLGDSVSITATATNGTMPYGYFWDQGLGSGQTHTISPDTSTTYTVTVTDANGCTGADQIHIMVNPLPNPMITGNTVLCEGQFGLLDGGANFVSYLWNVGDTTQTLTVSNPGFYQLTVSDANGCIASDEIEVILNDTLQPIITGDLSLCAGDTSTLNAGAGFDHYQWSSGDTTQVISVSASGSYSVTVSSNSGCSGSDEVDVEVHEVPMVNIALVQGETCSNDCNAEIAANGSGGILPYDFLWSNGGTNEIQSDLCSGMYEVTLTDSNLCSAIDSIFIESGIPRPMAEALNLGPFCLEDSIFLVAEGGESYAWSGPNGFISNEQNPSFGPSTLDDAGLYMVIVTNDSLCSDTSSTNVIVNALPNPSIEGDSIFCVGDSVTLSLNDIYVAYSWSTGDTSASIVISDMDTYMVSVIDTNACSAIDSFIVIASDTVLPIIQGDLIFCDGDSSILSVKDEFYSYQWNTGDTTTSIQVDTTGMYSVTVAINLGCTGSAFVQVKVNALPIGEISLVQGETCAQYCDAQISAIAQGGVEPYTYSWNNGKTEKLQIDLCSGDYTVTITDANLCSTTASITIEDGAEVPIANAINTGPYCEGDSIFLQGESGEVYQWSGPNGFISMDQNPAFGPSSISNGGIYELVVTNGTICSDTAYTEVEIIELPNITIIGESMICLGDTSKLEVDAMFSNYLWSTGDTTNSISVFEAGTYSLTVTGLNACTASDSFVVMVNDQLEPMISGVLEFCEGDSTVLEVEAMFDDYIWSTGDTTAQIMVHNAGSYMVTVSNNANCSGSAEIEVSQNTNPIANAGVDEKICFGDSVIISASATEGISPYQYFWDNSIGEGQTHTINPLLSSSYIVSVTDSKGCSDTDEISIDVAELLEVMVFEDSTIVITGGTAPYDTSFIENHDTLCVIVVDALGCEAENCVIISSIDYLEEDQLMIFPIPTNDFIQIRSSKGVLGQFPYAFNSMTGQNVKTGIIPVHGNIDITELPSGVYILQIKGKGYKVVKI